MTQRKKKWTENEKEIIKQNYLNHDDEYCAKILNRTKRAVKDIRRVYNLNRPKKYIINIEFEKYLNEPEFVYLLGYIWADGHLSKKGHSINLQIKKSDGDSIKSIIEKFGKWSIKNYDRKAPHGKIETYTHFYINDKKFHDFLKTFNYQSKSVSVFDKIYNFISPEIGKYFIRGFFDGDGCCSFTKGPNTKYWKKYVSFTGPHDYDWSFFRQILKENDIDTTLTLVISKYGRNSQLMITNNKSIINLSNLIYNDKIFGLSRKKETFEKIIDFIRKDINSITNVSFDKKIGKYRPAFSDKGKRYSFKHYDVLEDALKAVNDRHKEITSDLYQIRKLLKS